MAAASAARAALEVDVDVDVDVGFDVKVEAMDAVVEGGKATFGNPVLGKTGDSATGVGGFETGVGMFTVTAGGLGAMGAVGVNGLGTMGLGCSVEVPGAEAGGVTRGIVTWGATPGFDRGGLTTGGLTGLDRGGFTTGATTGGGEGLGVGALGRIASQISQRLFAPSFSKVHAAHDQGGRRELIGTARSSSVGSGSW